jgi:hypothetical protein
LLNNIPICFDFKKRRCLTLEIRYTPACGTNSSINNVRGMIEKLIFLNVVLIAVAVMLK